MKKFISLMFLFAATVCIVSCGDEEGDPKPTKTNLELIQEGIVGSTWNFVKAEVTDGTEPIQTITNGCVTGKYQYSVDDFIISFLSSTKLRFKSKCDPNFDFEYYWKITEVGNDYNLLIDNDTNFSSPYINSIMLGTDVINGDKTLKSIIKLKFKEIAMPVKNWLYSPVVYVTLQ